MGFLCAAALQPGKAPPASIVGERFDRTYVHALRACVADDQGHWQSEFATLGDAEQEALAPFLLDVGIVQQVRKHDYERLRGLVLLASDHGPVSSALYPQAVELLERIAVCSAAINERRVGSSTSEPTAETLGAA
jgi:hypothetical protein